MTMKYVPLIITLLLISATSPRVYEGELIERQGVLYADNEVDGFTGVNRMHHENG